MRVKKMMFFAKITIIVALALITGDAIIKEQREKERNRSTSVVEYQETEITQVIPGGVMTGIYAETKGVLALGTGDINTDTGEVTSPAEGVIEKGDYILACNGEELDSKEELTDLINASGGNELELKILRDEKEQVVYVEPKSDGEKYCIGLWVRDDIAGIGMITYVTKDLEYGALGHCISDIDLGIEMDIREGTLHSARLTDIVKGEEGHPGQLIGYVTYYASYPKGYVYKNDECGIGGELLELPEELESVSYVNIGETSELEEGPALLICDVSGERQAYEIEIEKIFNIFTSGNKNFTIKVTDERLLELTGGIVQGMSGSPIIQDGKLVGAVTHVLVDDPTRGYGIFIENMLD